MNYKELELKTLNLYRDGVNRQITENGVPPSSEEEWEEILQIAVNRLKRHHPYPYKVKMFDKMHKETLAAVHKFFNGKPVEPTVDIASTPAPAEYTVPADTNEP